MRYKYVRNYLKISLKRQNSESENVVSLFETQRVQKIVKKIPWSVPDRLVMSKSTENGR